MVMNVVEAAATQVFVLLCCPGCAAYDHSVAAADDATLRRLLLAGP